MKQLDPKAVWLFFFSFAARWVFVVFWPIIIIAMVISATEESLGGAISRVVSVAYGGAAVIALVGVYLILCYLWSRLTYRFYRYELREDGFRKESGVIWKRYVTIPYERIQNVDIYRGVIARLLGLSDLQIQTAGASAIYAGNTAWGLGAEGRLPGLSAETAEALRDELIARARNSKNQGL